MGEMSEMIIEGELCQYCGVYMGEPIGYPISCSDCEDDEKQTDEK